MRIKIQNSIIIICVFISFVSLAYAQEVTSEVILGKKVVIFSKILNENRTIFIRTPQGYDESKENYPVLYRLDADMQFLCMQSAATIDFVYEIRERSPQMILIGIENVDRSRDMIPVKVPTRTNTGGSDKFIQFIKIELIPYIEKNYRCDDARFFYGESNAGLLVFYTLLTEPDLFEAYIAASPTFGWCPEFLKTKWNALLSKRSSLDKKLYINYAEDDINRTTNWVPYITDMINKQKPRGFELKSEFIKGDSHVPFISLYNGLLFVFD